MVVCQISFRVVLDPAVSRKMLRELGGLLRQDGAGLVKQDGARAGGALVDGDDGAKDRTWVGLAPVRVFMFGGGAAAAFRFQILFPFLMRFEIGQMHVQRGVRDLDFAGEQQHRSHHQQDRSKEQDAGHHPFVEIGGDHRAKRQHEGNGGAGLDDADQAISAAASWR